MRTAAARAAWLVTLAGALAGCVEHEVRLEVALDGTGRGEVLARHDERAAEALRARVRREVLGQEAAGSAQRRPPGPPDPTAPGWAHAQARGVEDFTLEAATRGEDGGVRLTAAFGSLEAAAKGGLFHGCEAAFERRPKKRWRFTLRPPWMPSGPGADDAWGGVPARSLAPFAPDAAAVRYRFVIAFPVPVLEANAPLSEDRRTVTYEVRGGDANPQALALELELPDEHPWTTFRHRPDLGALARRLVALPPPEPEQVPALEEPEPGEPVPPKGDAPR